MGISSYLCCGIPVVDAPSLVRERNSLSTMGGEQMTAINVIVETD
jgi:hypothetical protein